MPYLKAKNGHYLIVFLTDYSLALIHATMLFWNHITLNDYLFHAYKYSCNDDSAIFQNNGITKLNICCSHFFKIVCNDIKKLNNNNTVKLFLKECMAASINFSNIDIFSKWFIYIAVILCSEKVNVQTENAITGLTEICLNNKFSEDIEKDFDFSNSSRYQLEGSIITEGSNYQKSPFFNISAY